MKQVSYEEIRTMVRDGQDVTSIDISTIKDMTGLFHSEIHFNQDISGWNVRNVERMSWMFYGATAFIEGGYFDKTIDNWAKQRNISPRKLIIIVVGG